MRCRAALLLPLALLVAGCASGADPTSKAATRTPTAEGRLDDARAQVAKLSSFAFRSVTEVPGANALQRTVVDGRAVVPDRVAYTVKVGATDVEVVRIGAQGYTRTLPGGTWASDPKPAATPAPGVVLQQVLAAADSPVDKGDVTFDGRTGRLLSAVLTADEVRATGLLDAKGGSDVTVTLALDPQGRVLRLAVELPVTTGGTQGVLKQITTYGSFGAVDPISAPPV